MELNSFQIPESLKSYIEQFETDPENAISRLENHVRKRNTGAAGFFFLAWLYYQNNNSKKAVQAAWEAKVHAPGSRLMEKLHYYLAHPQAFDAWEPDPIRENSSSSSVYNDHNNDHSHPIQDLDALIAKLSSIDSRRIKPSFGDDNQPDLGKKSAQVDDIVTETLAGIYEKQKNYGASIDIYKKLRMNQPSKKDHFDKQISRLRQLEQENEKPS